MQSVVIAHSKNMTIRSLTSINSKFFHMFLENCENIIMKGVHIIAPENSPNTDGIHTILSTNITIENSDIRTGDDCISISHGTTYLQINNVTCGPGHGIRFIFTIITHFILLFYFIFLFFWKKKYQ